MSTQLDIGTLLGTPSSAQLVIDNGQIMLVVAQHEHRWKMTVEAFELGPHVEIGELLRTLDKLGLMPVAPPVASAVAPVASSKPEPVQPVNGIHAFVCDQCDKTYTSKAGLGSHRFHVHGTSAAKPAPNSTTSGETFTCDECGQTVGTRQGLATHRTRKHSLKAPPAVQPKPQEPMPAPNNAHAPPPQPEDEDEEPSSPPPMRLAEALHGHAVDERCTVCKRLWRLHEVCRSCNAALGIEHEDKGINGLCTDCYVGAFQKRAA